MKKYGLLSEIRRRRKWVQLGQQVHKLTPYELRHTYVSINDEMPDGLKKQAVGHSANMDTEGVYGHQKAGDLDRIADYSTAAFQSIISKGNK